MTKRKGAHAQGDFGFPEQKPTLSGWCMKNLPSGQHEICPIKSCTCSCHDGELRNV